MAARGQGWAPMWAQRSRFHGHRPRAAPSAPASTSEAREARRAARPRGARGGRCSGSATSRRARPASPASSPIGWAGLERRWEPRCGGRSRRHAAMGCVGSRGRGTAAEPRLTRQHPGTGARQRAADLSTGRARSRQPGANPCTLRDAAEGCVGSRGRGAQPPRRSSHDSTRVIPVRDSAPPTRRGKCREHGPRRTAAAPQLTRQHPGNTGARQRAADPEHRPRDRASREPTRVPFGTRQREVSVARAGAHSHRAAPHTTVPERL